MADADVFCFQEVSDNFAKLDGGADQSAQLAALLPDHLPVFRPAIEAIDATGQVHRFGNMTLSRLPVLQIANHLLPWPGAGGDAQHAPSRAGGDGRRPRSVRCVWSTRILSITPSISAKRRLRGCWICSRRPRPVRWRRFPHGEPYGSQTLAASSLLCGDFNFDVADRQHASIDRSTRPGLNYRDAWTICHPGRPRSPTCGLYDHAQWTNGPDCRDFIFATEDLAGRIRSRRGRRQDRCLRSSAYSHRVG